jgi:2'-5' RNA ligase
VLARADWRLPRPEGLHATLHFLGDVPRDRLAALGESLGRALAGLAAPSLRLSGTGAFPSFARPRVLWIGCEERAEAGRLAACLHAARAGVVAAGFDLGPDAARPFRPHVTVARPRGRGRVPEAFASLAFARDWDPPASVLYESLVESGGNVYAPLATFPFSR